MLSEIFYFYTTTTHMSLSTNNEKDYSETTTIILQSHDWEN